MEILQILKFNLICIMVAMVTGINRQIFTDGLWVS